MLTEEVHINITSHDTKILPAGAFIRPLEYEYVPKHIIDSNLWKFFNKETEIFCYTRYGIVAIAKKIIREAN